MNVNLVLKLALYLLVDSFEVLVEEFLFSKRDEKFLFKYIYSLKKMKI